ncbi:hypothetical protein NL526_29195, partial [Klebsiella pneumoniae]|nr:hypothetical protein [Klebsiella pneumoniae]
MQDLSNIPVIPALLAAAVTSFAAARAAQRRPRISGPREPRVWFGLGVLFIAFVAVKCFGVVQGLETFARDHVRAEGMYD